MNKVAKSGHHRKRLCRDGKSCGKLDRELEILGRLKDRTFTMDSHGSQHHG